MSLVRTLLSAWASATLLLCWPTGALGAHYYVISRAFLEVLRAAGPAARRRR